MLALPINQRFILHVDLDAFFVGCEILRRPELKSLPVVVGGGIESHPGDKRNPGRAVVSTSSYEARKFQVKSGMPLAKAFWLCPSLINLPVDIPYYSQLSKQVFAILRDYAVLIEPGSLDEAFLDITAACKKQDISEKIAIAIQKRVQLGLGLSLSIGLSRNKTVAKIASDFQKPHGITIVKSSLAQFLAPLPIEKMPGIGTKTALKLHSHNIRTLAQLAAISEVNIKSLLGANGLSLRLRAQGIDETPVVAPGISQSISSEETYDRDICELEKAKEQLTMLSAIVGHRLRANNLETNVIAIRLRWSDFTTITRQKMIPTYIDTDIDLKTIADRLLEQAWDKTRAVRLLGVKAEHIRPQIEQNLYHSKHKRLDLAIDHIQKKYGKDAIHRGGLQTKTIKDWHYRE